MNDQKLKMVNRLLSIIRGIEIADNNPLSERDNIIFSCWPYIQVVKPLVLLDSKKPAMTNSKLCVKYGLTFCQVGRILKEQEVGDEEVKPVKSAWSNRD